MPSIYFTFNEANNLISWLNQVFDSLEPLQIKIQKLSMEIRTLMQSVYSNGGSNKENEIGNRESVIAETSKKIEVHLRDIQERGIIVRNILQGLVDFPYILEGREVYLCWIRGETQIRFFHETNTGYADRQSLENFGS